MLLGKGQFGWGRGPKFIFARSGIDPRTKGMKFLDPYLPFLVYN